MWRKENVFEEDIDFIRKYISVAAGEIKPFYIEFLQEVENFDEGARVLRIRKNKDFINVVRQISLKLMISGLISNSEYLENGEVLDLNGRVIKQGLGYDPHMSINEQLERISEQKILIEEVYLSYKNKGIWEEELNFPFSNLF